jgi:hypothetical protein
MDKNISRKMPRREAKLLKPTRMDKEEEDTKKAKRWSECPDYIQYRQGNIMTFNTAKNEINKLISASNPK